jgi:MFS family permease
VRARISAHVFAAENRRWWTLLAVSFGLFMIMLDNTVVNVALPSIQRSLDADQSELEWVVVSYALTFATFMLTGGKLADYFGRRRLFVVGLAIFTLASLACGLAPSAGFLIGARAVQGLGAAIMNPATLGIITATFPPRQRGMAIGIWAGVSAMALAIGPLLGGLITDHIDWSWIFFVNVPVGILGIVVARWAIDESRDMSHEQRLDLPRILACFAVAALALAAFVLLERHQRVPMLDLTLFRDSTFTGANITMLLVSLAMFGIFFFNSLFIQNVLGYSATETGAVFLPMTLLIILVAPAAGKYSDHVGSRWLVGVGMSLVSLSLVLFAQLDVGSTFWDIVPGLITGGLGMALTMTPTTAAAMGAVDVDKAGVGSAVLNCSRQVGGSLGIAVMGAIVAGQVDVTSPLPVRAQQFVDGYHIALYVAAVIALCGAAVAVLTVRKHRHVELAEVAA